MGGRRLTRGRQGRRWPALALAIAAVAAVVPGAPAQAPPAPAPPGQAEAPTAATLDLAAAMRRARGDAPEVAAAEARARAGRARVDEARGHRLPTVSLSESWIRTDAPADVFGLLLNQERFSFQQFVASDPNQPDALDSSTTRLEVTLPVYAGGEIATRVAQARHGEEAAAAALRRAGDLAAFRAGEAYVRLAQAREEVALLERSLETVEAHVELARAYVEEGMVVASELLRAEVEASRLRDELAAARGRARIAEAGLSFRLGTPLDTRWALAPLGDPPPVDGSLALWIARAARRPDLAAARAQAAAAALEPRAVRARRLPRVGVAARYDLVDEPPFGTDGDHHALMAFAAIDLFAGGRHRAAEAAARAEAEAVASEIAMMEEGIRLEVHDAHLAATVARERLATAGDAEAAARETERILQERYAQGLVKTVDLLDATSARTEAESRAAVARAEAHLGTLRLEMTAGALAPDAATETRDDDGGTR